jgi:hypothetical protein
MVLEGLVNKVGEEAEYLMVHYINSDKLDTMTQLNIIRVAGYIRSPHFLIPLKKTIDTNEDIHVRTEATISVSKYNDQRALTILNQALINIRNPLLQETISNEISKIKRNNPVLALLPRFLEGDKNLTEFQVTLGILKRILTPVDAPMFVPYLNCGRQLIEEGAFEILCFTADEKLQDQILTFFQERFEEFSRRSSLAEGSLPPPGPGGEKKRDSDSKNDSDEEDDRFYLLVLKLKYYFIRNPSLIDQHLDNLGTQLLYTEDSRVRGLFIAIICRSQESAAISFMSECYDSEPELRKTIIDSYSGNDAAVDLLFEKYQTAEGDIKKTLIRSLLNTHKGLDYFYLHFTSLEEKEQEIIVNHLPYGGRHDLSGFCKMVFRAEQIEQKRVLLEKVKTHYEFSVQELLFEPALEKEFALMEQEYLDTLSRLFPLRTAKMLLRKLAEMDLPASRVKRYLQIIKAVMPSGFAFNIQDKRFVTLLFNKIIQFNSPELGSLFLSILKDINTFDLHTYYNLHESLGLFTAQRERKISPQEVEDLRRARKNLNELYEEIQRLEEGLKALDRLFVRETMDFEQMVDFLNQHSLCAALYLQQVSQRVRVHLESAAPEVLKQWVQLFYQFSLLGVQVKSTILARANQQKKPLNAEMTALYQFLSQEPLKIVIHLGERSFTAVLKEQCHELLPIIPTTTEDEEWQEGDILLCDTVTLKEFIFKHALPSRKLFLVLDKQEDLSSYKSYNPRPLIKPLSAYQVFKEILKEILL